MKNSQIIYQVLKELRYTAVIKRAPLVRKALEDAFDGVGEKDEIAELFLHHMSLMYGVNDNELATRFDIIEHSIHSVFGDAARVILELMTDYLLKNDPGFKNNYYSSGTSLSQNLCKLADKEVLEFVRSVPPHEHILFLYRQQKSKAPLFLYYFDKLAAAGIQKGAMCSQHLDVPDDLQIQQTHYKYFVDLPNGSIDTKKTMDWISSLFHKSSKGAVRILGEEDTWFFDNGLSDQIMLVEHQIGRHIDDMVSIMCTYDINKLNEKDTLAQLILSHNYVILDGPYSLYRAPS
jgi:hypothetical protein